MAKNLIICVGNTGTNIGKLVANKNSLSDVEIYAIDSVAASIDMATINRIISIPIISDDKSGSGRNRERGKAMYKFHEEVDKEKKFEKMYDACAKAKQPVLVITSSAGGTGSGATVPICEALISRGIDVIPIIVCPNKDDPDAYHLNTSDLLMELDEVGVSTYTTFTNLKGDADYGPINDDIVSSIEIIFGKKYPKTTLDSIDDSDLDVVLSTPGRFISVTAKAPDIKSLKKEITRKVFSGFQAAWTEEEADTYTFMTASSLTSLFASQDFKDVFSEVESRIKHVYDGYKNISNQDINECEATIIVAGLPRQEIRIIDSDFKEVKTIGESINKSKRPSFISKRKAEPTVVKTKDGSDSKQFRWH